MRKLPYIGPLLVPTVADILLTSIGHLFRPALILSLVLVPIFLLTPKRATPDGPREPSSFVRNLSVESPGSQAPTASRVTAEKSSLESATTPAVNTVSNATEAGRGGSGDD
jgi:hypothetical protein